MNVGAMAGLADDAIAFEQILGLMGLTLAGLAAGMGIFCRSKVAAFLGLAMLYVICILSRPWHGFWPSPSPDPDMGSVNIGYLIQARWWALISIGEACSLAVACWNPPRKRSRVAARSQSATFVDRWLD